MRVDVVISWVYYVILTPVLLTKGKNGWINVGSDMGIEEDSIGAAVK